jgi:hypothetical protein
MRDRYTLLMMICMLVLLGTAVGCTIVGGRNTNQYADSPYAKYYVGTRGVVADFVNMPTRVYYYGTSDPASNSFSFGVRALNQGAGFSRGGVYVSGFDPSLIEFQQIPIFQNQQGACSISVGLIGYSEFGGIFRCDGVSASVGSHSQSFSIDSIGKLASRFGKKWFDQSQFDFGVGFQNLENVGSQFTVNIKDRDRNLEYYQHGRLFIALFSGIDFGRYGGQEFLLAGNTYDFPGGEEAYFTYDGRVKDWPPGLDQTTQHLLLTSCYQYVTYADPVVCIDPQPESDNRKVCQPRSSTWNGGNGAPVAITSIEQENTPRKIIFRINVKNVGAGTVYDAGELEKCSPYYPGRVTPEDLNIVRLGDVRIGNVGLANSGGSGGMTCYPEVIRLDPVKGTGTTTCTYPLQYVNLKSAYETPLVVELWYGYSEARQRDLIIKRVS